MTDASPAAAEGSTDAIDARQSGSSDRREPPAPAIDPLSQVDRSLHAPAAPRADTVR